MPAYSLRLQVSTVCLFSSGDPSGINFYRKRAHATKVSSRHRVHLKEHIQFDEGLATKSAVILGASYTLFFFFCNLTNSSRNKRYNIRYYSVRDCLILFSISAFLWPPLTFPFVSYHCTAGIWCEYGASMLTWISCTQIVILVLFGVLLAAPRPLPGLSKLFFFPQRDLFISSHRLLGSYLKC